MAEKISVEKRLEILNAAMKLFSEKGFDRTTVDEIASSANVGKGTIYLYFKNKEQIFIAIFEEGLDQICRMITEILAGTPDFLECLQKLIFTQLKFVEDNKEFYHIFLEERLSLTLGQNSQSHKHSKEVHDQLQEMIVNYFRNGIKHGFFQKGDPSTYAFALSGILTHFAFHWIIERRKENLTNRTNEIMDIFLYGVKNREISSNLEVS